MEKDLRSGQTFFLTQSAEETERVGEELAQTLTAGAVLAFVGGLGTGKTAFTRGVARGLGCAARVTSPTFTIVNEYEGGRLPLFHFDLYRLAHTDELFEIGWEDYLARGGICCVEWSENAGDLLPRDAVFVELARGETDEERRISIAWPDGALQSSAGELDDLARKPEKSAQKGVAGL